VKHRVEVVELDAGVVGGEAPVDGADGGVAGGHPGRDLLLQGLTVGQAAVETLACQDAQFNFSEPKMLHVLSLVLQCVTILGRVPVAESGGAPGCWPAAGDARLG